MDLSDFPAHMATDGRTDAAGNPFFHCPLAEQKVANHKEKYFLRENFTEIYDLMRSKLNYTHDPYLFFDTLTCMKEHNLKLPEWCSNESFYQTLKFISWNGVNAQFGMGPYDDEMQRKLRGGSALRGVVSRIACKTNYSGWTPHDMTLAAILSTFSDIHAILGEVPLIDYGANIAFELWTTDKTTYKLKVFYANSWKEEPFDVTRFAPGCENSVEFCNVSDFIDHSRLLFFDNIQEECSKGVTSQTPHIVRRSIGADITEEVDLIELY
ncbi:unnamed protein product [Thelazia callipaeda]|uniref:acid phosphatase n=1 Tax=Thelazia callipaeda TaxID=103827 RepID=A0A0N5D2F8_THECL|nr:unnamed protein product [Thelazia callipaeda]